MVNNPLLHLIIFNVSLPVALKKRVMNKRDVLEEGFFILETKQGNIDTMTQKALFSPIQTVLEISTMQVQSVISECMHQDHRLQSVLLRILAACRI